MITNIDKKISFPTARCAPIRGLSKETIFAGEMIAMEVISSANGCDKVGMSDANVEDIG